MIVVTVLGLPKSAETHWLASFTAADHPPDVTNVRSINVITTGSFTFRNPVRHVLVVVRAPKCLRKKILNSICKVERQTSADRRKNTNTESLEIEGWPASNVFPETTMLAGIFPAGSEASCIDKKSTISWSTEGPNDHFGIFRGFRLIERVGNDLLFFVLLSYFRANDP